MIHEFLLWIYYLHFFIYKCLWCGSAGITASISSKNIREALRFPYRLYRFPFHNHKVIIFGRESPIFIVSLFNAFGGESPHFNYIIHFFMPVSRFHLNRLLFSIHWYSKVSVIYFFLFCLLYAHITIICDKLWYSISNAKNPWKCPFPGIFRGFIIILF